MTLILRQGREEGNGPIWAPEERRTLLILAGLADSSFLEQALTATWRPVAISTASLHGRAARRARDECSLLRLYVCAYMARRVYGVYC